MTYLELDFLNILNEYNYRGQGRVEAFESNICKRSIILFRISVWTS